MKVKIYRNSRNQKWSVVFKNKVIGHADGVTLENVSFHIDQKKRLESLEQNKKTQNASAKGNLVNVINYTAIHIIKLTIYVQQCNRNYICSC